MPRLPCHLQRSCGGEAGQPAARGSSAQGDRCARQDPCHADGPRCADGRNARGHGGRGSHDPGGGDDLRPPPAGGTRRQGGRHDRRGERGPRRRTVPPARVAPADCPAGRGQGAAVQRHPLSAEGRGRLNKRSVQ